MQTDHVAVYGVAKRVHVGVDSSDEVVETAIRFVDATICSVRTGFKTRESRVVVNPREDHEEAGDADGESQLSVVQDATSLRPEYQGAGFGGMRSGRGVLFRFFGERDAQGFKEGEVVVGEGTLGVIAGA